MNKTDEALKLAKECGATTYTNRHYPDATAVTFSPLAWEKFCEQAFAAPVQERELAGFAMKDGIPVSAVFSDGSRAVSVDGITWTAQPPAAQRQWVGLTADERYDIRASFRGRFLETSEFAEQVQLATEAKLEEKNT